MGRADLHEAVALAIGDAGDLDGVPYEPSRAAVAAAIRVVLAEARRSIQALGTDWRIVRAGVTGYEPRRAEDFKREALAALARLEPPPPV